GRHDRGVHRAADLFDERPYLLRRTSDPVGELADLVGDHPEALAGLIRAGGLDARVDGENVRLVRELVDHLEDVSDLLRLAAEVEHVGDDQVDLALDAADRLLGLLYRLIAHTRGPGGLLRDVCDALGALGDLPGR